MGKVKNALAILLAIILLAGGSLLPVAAARFQDKTTTNVVRYENIEALQLRLEENVMSVTFYEKLRLITNGAAIEIPDGEVELPKEGILEMTNAALLPYMNLFFGKPLDNDYLHYIKYMVYDESNPARLCYFWHVEMSLDASYTDHIVVALDDESGKILAIEVADPDFNIDESYLQELQENLAALYFESLGLSPALAWPVYVDAASERGDGNLCVAAGYQLTDAVYGEVTIEIGVHTDGFYIYIC